ncbi:uncharacterized protein [Centruroides vittatus]|uniref:uncharacterized protein n=1 Tax=Centruroides vittatus TaxID=120091 RepID=UPI0035102C17
MPTTRRGVINSRKRRQTKLTSFKNPKKVFKRKKMEQHNIETNGCEDGPTSLVVSNHSDSTQNGKLSERPIIKPATPSAIQEGRSTRHTSGSNRLRRHSPGVTSNTSKTSPSTVDMPHANFLQHIRLLTRKGQLKIRYLHLIYRLSQLSVLPLCTVFPSLYRMLPLHQKIHL